MKEKIKELGEELLKLRAAPLFHKPGHAESAITFAYELLAELAARVEALERRADAVQTALAAIQVMHTREPIQEISDEQLVRIFGADFMDGVRAYDDGPAAFFEYSMKKGVRNV